MHCIRLCLGLVIASLRIHQKKVVFCIFGQILVSSVYRKSIFGLNQVEQQEVPQADTLDQSQGNSNDCVLKKEISDFIEIIECPFKVVPIRRAVSFNISAKC